MTKGGVNEYIRSTKVFKRHQFNTGYKNNLSCNAYDAIISRNWKILINMPPVLMVYDPEKKSSISYTSELEYDGSVKDNRIPMIEDAKGGVWLGSTRGLCRFDPQSGKFACFHPAGKTPDAIRSQNITALFEDHSGITPMTPTMPGR